MCCGESCLSSDLSCSPDAKAASAVAALPFATSEPASRSFAVPHAEIAGHCRLCGGVASLTPRGAGLFFDRLK